MCVYIVWEHSFCSAGLHQGIEVRDIRARMMVLLSSFPWKIPTFAMITGALRDRWELLTEDHAAELTSAVNEQLQDWDLAHGQPPRYIVNPISAILGEDNNTNFFVTSQSESEYELIAAEKFYQQLSGMHVLTNSRQRKRL